MKARDLMTPNPECVLPNEEISSAAEIMARLDVGIVPVVDDFTTLRLRGVITDRDIAVRHVANRHTNGCLVKDHMTSGKIDVVHPDADAHDVLGRMAHDQVRRLPVVDDDHRLVGIIAQADVARRLGPSEPKQVEQMLERISEPAHRPSDSLVSNPQ
jgi:CBS domain-containing protein